MTVSGVEQNPEVTPSHGPTVVYGGQPKGLCARKNRRRGRTGRSRLDENIGAIAVELTPDDLREIDSAASKITVQGARYPEKLEKLTGR